MGCDRGSARLVQTISEGVSAGRTVCEGLLPPEIRRERFRAGRTPRAAALRRDRLRCGRLRQRQGGRAAQGRFHAVRIRRDEPRQARRKHARHPCAHRLRHHPRHGSGREARLRLAMGLGQHQGRPLAERRTRFRAGALHRNHARESGAEGFGNPGRLHHRQPFRPRVQGRTRAHGHDRAETRPEQNRRKPLAAGFAQARRQHRHGIRKTGRPGQMVAGKSVSLLSVGHACGRRQGRLGSCRALRLP